jgi:3-mercaptopyruvate sulfurtransferase SseA
MSNASRPWVLIGLIGLIVIGGVLIAVPLLTPNEYPLEPTPIPTALTIDQNIPYPTVPRVSVGDARAAHELKQAVFVDVRTAEQYAQSHVPGAKSIPLNELESRLNELNKDQAIITYCT